MNKYLEEIRWKLQRVDIQVSIFMAIVVLISSLAVYLVSYQITYNDMLSSLRERVVNLHSYLEKDLDRATFFEINTKEDMQKPMYQKTKVFMENLRNVTGMMYLYTAKKTDDGRLIYIIDGLSEKEDFRYPGDPIEPEIHSAMQRALNNEIVLPSNIENTEWGKIFITYFPFHDANGNVIGVLGMEIAANSQYDTYRMLRLATPISILFFCLVSFFFSARFFRRISNPTTQDLVSTDQLTRLKSRNAFELELNNMRYQNQANCAVIVVDLDNLKKVNDNFGHAAGDVYIKQAATTVRNCLKKGFIAYRTGGDEFAIVALNATEELVRQYVEDISYVFDKIKPDLDINLSMSIGWAIFDAEHDKNISDTYTRADAEMYANKRKYNNKSI